MSQRRACQVVAGFVTMPRARVRRTRNGQTSNRDVCFPTDDGWNFAGSFRTRAAGSGDTHRGAARGYGGDFTIKLTADGYVWEIPAGQMTIRYTAVVKDGAWREVGDRITPGKEPVRFFEMNLKRVGDTTWPAGGAVSPK